MLQIVRFLLLFFGFLCLVSGLAPTDTIRDADLLQSGYLPNHNIDPAVVNSTEFGQLWKVTNNVNEVFYAKPLVYTPPSTGKSIVFVASSQNYIRTFDAVTGAHLLSRQVQTPFLEVDIKCTDTPNTIGITGTPVIDPNTDTVYFYAKSYIANYRASGSTGVANGVYYFYAVNILTLKDVPGYPMLIEGTVAQNDHLKYFIGGVTLQRPSLAMINGVVYAAFGGHCDYFNYTGMVIGVNAASKKVVTAFAMESGSLAQHKTLDVRGGGGEAGIWMSGMGLASDGNRLFFVTGNGEGHQNGATPQLGSSGLTTLDECIVNLAVNSKTGVLSLTDYFEPYNYITLDAGDLDLGSGGIAMLDPAYFNGTGVSAMAIAVGKSGQVYVVNADNLGGYKLGSGQTNNVLQTLSLGKGVWGGCGSYPLEGGYIYCSPIGAATSVYKLGHDKNGAPVFSKAGQTPVTSAARIGVGVPTITSYKGQPGTGIMWLTDPNAGLMAFSAVPGSDGNLQRLTIPQTNGISKFQRPAFGDGRLYVTDSAGSLYCLGSPVNQPLTCNGPIDFGSTALGTSSKRVVNCTANINLTNIKGATVGDTTFTFTNASLPHGAVAKGASFSFPVTWNLSNVVVSNSGISAPGVKSTALTILTTNAVVGYLDAFPVSLTGTEVSKGPFLTINPGALDIGGLIITPTTANATLSASFVIGNAGLTAMTIVGYAWTTDPSNVKGYTNSTSGTGGVYGLGVGFTSTGLPAVGSSIGAGVSLSVPVTFTAVKGSAAYGSVFQVWTTGGTQYTIITASASPPPIAQLTIANGNGGWLPPTNLTMNFGNVKGGTSVTSQIRICNSGGSVLTISKSKPPGSNSQLKATAPAVDFHEGEQIPVGTCAFGTVIFQPAVLAANSKPVVLTDSWTLNTDDLTFGVHIVNIKGTATT